MVRHKHSKPNESIENEKLMSCLQLGKLLTSTLNIDEILELIMLKASQLFQAQNWSLLLFDEKAGKLCFKVVVGIDKSLIKDVCIIPGQGVAGRVFTTGEPVFLSDAEDSEQINRTVDKLCDFTTRSIACIPVKIHGIVLGVIEVINVGDMDEFKAKEFPVLNLLADYLAIAIENSKYVSQIQKMSITDEYTNLYNARYLHEKLPALIQKAANRNKKLAVIFMDIDNFKQVVDTYGHLLGSLVLKEVGQTILQNLSPNDYLFKYGGDEYVIVLPDRDKKSAIRQIEQIKKCIRSSHYLQGEKSPVKITASFGVAIYPEDAQTKKDLLLKADHFMYEVKNTTKDGIASA